MIQILTPLAADREKEILTASPSAPQLSFDSKRSIGHLLRGIVSVEKGYLAEQIIAEMFMQPLLK
jgi:hypothetical protein